MLARSLVEWTSEYQQACKQLKQLCRQTPFLACANYRKPFKLHTYASERELDAVLYQRQDDFTNHAIVCANCTLSKLEKNYDAHKLEFLALKWSATERFHEYLYDGHFEVYTGNNPLIYILTTAKLDTTGQRWVASLANYNFKIFYKSGKLNVDADALSQILWKNTYVDHMEPLVVKVMLQSKLVMNVDGLEVYPQLEVVQESLVVDSSPKLTNNEWIRGQSEDPNISLIIPLLKSEKLKSYVAKEIDSSELHVLLKYRKDF